MPENRKKTILILGAGGVVGSLLRDNLSGDYRVLASDISDRKPLPAGFLDIDIRDFDGLLAAIPEGVDVLVNLTALPPMPPLVEPRDLRVMSAVYVQGAYNVFAAASRCGIPRVIYASSNHVTGGLEVEGVSMLDRSISIGDPPKPSSAYGAMKCCGESFGELFAVERDLSVISLRLGTVPKNEAGLLKRAPRGGRTLLSHKDTVGLFRAAIETDLHYGVFYGVSDNPERPWEIADAIRKLGFRPQENSADLLRKNRGLRNWGFWWGRKLRKRNGKAGR